MTRSTALPHCPICGSHPVISIGPQEGEYTARCPKRCAGMDVIALGYQGTRRAWAKLVHAWTMDADTEPSRNLPKLPWLLAAYLIGRDGELPSTLGHVQEIMTMPVFGPKAMVVFVAEMGRALKTAVPDESEREYTVLAQVLRLPRVEVIDDGEGRNHNRLSWLRYPAARARLILSGGASDKIFPGRDRRRMLERQIVSTFREVGFLPQIDKKQQPRKNP